MAQRSAKAGLPQSGSPAAGGGRVLLARSKPAKAIAVSSVSLATLIAIGSVPVFVTCAAAVLERRLPRPAPGRGLLQVLGLCCSAATGEDVPPGRWRSAGCALGAARRSLTLVNHRPVPGLDPRVTALGCLLGGTLLVPLAAATGMTFADASRGGVLLYLGLAPTALAYLAYFGGCAPRLRSRPSPILNR